MKVGVWKRAVASMLAAALVFTGMDVSGPCSGAGRGDKSVYGWRFR